MVVDPCSSATVNDLFSEVLMKIAWALLIHRKRNVVVIKLCREKKPSEKLWDAKYERYTRHIRVRRWIYEANECRRDFVGWLAVEIYTENHERDTV